MSFATLINITLAALIGVVIGFERQWNQGMAGLRTNALVAFGAACFVTLSANSDRVTAQIVSGIGFLGAGVILREGPTIRGLNTAATLWCSAAAGALSGAGRHIEATYCGIGVVVINLGLRGMQAAINRRAPHPVDVETVYEIEILCDTAEEANVRALVSSGTYKSGLSLRSLHSEKRELPEEGVRVAAELSAHARLDAVLEEIVGRLGLENGVTAARWHVANAVTTEAGRSDS